MALLHKLIQGAPHWLPFALSKLRALARLGLPFVGQTFDMGDGARVSVRIAEDQHHIRITEGVGYEFFTSEHIDLTYTSPGYYGGTSYTNFVKGSYTRNKGNSGRPIASGAFTPGPEDRWVARPVESTLSVDDPFLMWGAWQNQKFFEYSWWPNNSGDDVVVSTQAQAPGVLSQCNWRSAYSYSRYGSGATLASDVTLDIPVGAYEGKKSKTGAPTFAQAWVWWRRGIVAKAGNGRSFFVMADNYGRFHVYPHKDYGPSYLATNYQTYTPPYPAWVTVPDAGAEKVMNQWLWEFNKDGTKCVCLPFHSEAGEFYKYGTSYATASPTGTFLSSDLDELPGDYELSREDSPGLVEFEIAITAGDTEDDFSVTFTLKRNDYFNDSGRYIFDAAYALKRAWGIAPDWVEEDTLVTAEIECFTPAGWYEAGPFTPDAQQPTLTTVHRFKGLRADYAFYANDANMGKTELRRLVVCTEQAGQFLTPSGLQWYRDAVSGGQYTPGGLGLTIVRDAGPDVGTAGYYTSLGPSGYLPYSDVAIGRKFGYLYASSLRAGAFIYEIDDAVANTAQVIGRAFGEDFYDETTPLGYTQAGPSPATPTSDVPVPMEAHGIYIHALMMSLSLELGVGFNFHPKGHWSSQVAGAAMGNNMAMREAFDIVQRRGRKKTSHRALFNKAFAQTRGHDFYPNVPGVSLYDIGSFRTYGYWR